MARYGLDLERKNKFDSRRKRTLVALFLCFCIALGSVSTFLLWRSLEYDFNKECEKLLTDVIRINKEIFRNMIDLKWQQLKEKEGVANV